MEGCSGLAVTAIGVSTVESIPLHHYKPGGLALRLYTGPHGAPRPPAGVSRGCLEWGLEVCEWISRPGSFPAYAVGLDKLRGVAGRWGVEAVVLDGLESWLHAPCASRLGLPLVARTQGLLEPGGGELGLLEALAVEYTYLLWGGGSNLALARAVERAAGAGVWVEIIVYTPRPVETTLLAPPLQAAREAGAPLHIVALDHGGGGPLTRLAGELERLHWPVYIHSPPYSRLDTRCPRCGTVVATRREGLLDAMELAKGGGCPRCGAPVPVRGGWRRGTPGWFRRLAPQGVYWIDPRALGGRPL
ncbi:pyruvate-formate lyase-activating enzyme [Aeropyrum camini]|uniref:Pyruvate-formate lyase-activating enzyme n=1 Tax=Aeropyrum camini SY1 = JCM 12091 TaxID=1198449 RepID=U3TDV9_9CREN|nr:pyruvate-formate lyase-activating enzyme [Aeropyrum camini]BAN90133.1 pyruvate-formate lyase-activating enzyme [Aeropyrum camini SY1 = JCM 12091]